VGGGWKKEFHETVQDGRKRIAAQYENTSGNIRGKEAKKEHDFISRMDGKLRGGKRWKSRQSCCRGDEKAWS